MEQTKYTKQKKYIRIYLHIECETNIFISIHMNNTGSGTHTGETQQIPQILHENYSLYKTK